MAIEKNPPKNPKSEFGRQADKYVPNEEDPGRVFVGHDEKRTFASDQEREAFEQQAEEAQRRSRARIEAANQEDLESKDAAKNNADKPTEGSGDIETQPVSMWQSNADKLKLKLVDKGDYFRFKPDQKKLEDQMRAVILRAVYEKGYKNLCFYKGKQIDLGMTSQASTILNQMQQEGIIPADVRVSSSRMDGPEPWLGIVGKWSRDWRNNRHDKKAETTQRLKYGQAKGFSDTVRRVFTKGVVGHNAESDLKRYGFNITASGANQGEDAPEAAARTPAEEAAAGEEETAGAGESAPKHPGSGPGGPGGVA